VTGGLATALVVDDEEMVRHLVRRMLEPDVCRVLEAEDGEAALRLIQTDRAAIDVVLTDLVMPGVDGFDLVHVLADNCPDLPIACMSGFANLGGVGDGVTVLFVSKPFTVETLVEAIGPLLARSREIRQQAGLTRDRAARGRAAAVDLVAAAIELHRRRADGPSKG
jgi:DNA-binding NtrC family response regulator